MKIALDYDKTYTADPTLWDYFGQKADGRGHTIYIVTFRGPDCPIDTIPVCATKVFYTDATPKKKYMEAQGIDIDIWIDDDPELIVYESNWTSLDRERWKLENGY